MDINSKVSELAEELGAGFDEMYLVIGITKSRFDAVLNGTGDEEDHKKCEDFFIDREMAFSSYSVEDTEVLKEFERLIIRERSQGKASQKIGLSSPTMSSLRKGRYNGNNEKIFAKLRAYFEIKNEQKELPSVFVPVDYAPTSISQMIYERLRNVHVVGGCAVITGDAGIGKTKTIQKYERDNSTKTIVITASVFYHNTYDVLSLLANELNINDTNRRRVKDAIFSKLSDGMLIIVDEAQELSYPAVNALRSISDYFEAKGETVGLAFVGNPCFYNKFNGRYTNDRVQVSSRFVTEPTYNAEQIQLEDTMMLYPQLAQQNMMREIMFLHCIATTPSLGQRKALFIFKNAYNFGKYDLDSLVKTAKEAKVHFDNLNEILHKIKNIPER